MIILFRTALKKGREGWKLITTLFVEKFSEFSLTLERLKRKIKPFFYKPFLHMTILMKKIQKSLKNTKSISKLYLNKLSILVFHTWVSA